MTVKTVPCPYDPEYCPGGEERGGPSSGAGPAAGTRQLRRHAASTGPRVAPDRPLRPPTVPATAPPKLDPVVRAAAADVNVKAARAVDPRVVGRPAARVGEGAPGADQPAAADKGRKATVCPTWWRCRHSRCGREPTRRGNDQLTFGANIANLGSGPLVVEGYRVNESTMTATQFEYRDGVPARSFPAGEFEWDPREGHLHWHFEDIAQYDLVAADGSITRSGKQAFCLAPTDPIDLTLPGRGAAGRDRPALVGLWRAVRALDPRGAAGGLG